MKLMTATKVSRAAIVQTARGRTSTARPTSKDRGTAVVMPAAPRARTARAMSWDTVALPTRTINQTQTSLRALASPVARGNRPSTTRPSARLSAFVSACRRVRVSGKRSKPTVPARKKNAPAQTAAMVRTSSATLIDRSPGPPVASGASGERGVPFLTNAIAANVVRSASVRATSTVAGASMAAPSNSRDAMPPVPSSWAAIMRSASPGPRRMRRGPAPPSPARIRRPRTGTQPSPRPSPSARTSIASSAASCATTG